MTDRETIVLLRYALTFFKDPSHWQQDFNRWVWRGSYMRPPFELFPDLSHAYLANVTERPDPLPDPEKAQGTLI